MTGTASEAQSVIGLTTRSATLDVAEGVASSLLKPQGATKPTFIVDADGVAYPVPKDASGPLPVNNGQGFQYAGGKGGANGQVANLRIMDQKPATGNAPAYPNGYVKYENAQRQAVNGYTDKTLSRQEAHIPRGSCEINPQ